ncbi:DciA family protein [Streptomyces sp. NPDC102441]|uniref:DciA family protein n=1 Tax=Streptomyces sp. NPDC102441 TaxID=3366176 RepID=UPI0038151ECD
MVRPYCPNGAPATAVDFTAISGGTVTAGLPTPNSADLARIALRQAKENARRTNAPAPRTKPRTSGRRLRSDGRDPLLLGGVIRQVVVDNGWQSKAVGRAVVDRWAAIVSEECALHWTAAAYDAGTGILTVVCDSNSWATMLELASPTLIHEVNLALGKGKGAEPKDSPLAAIDIRRRTCSPAAQGPAVLKAEPHTACQTPPGAPLPNEYLRTREQLREAKAMRDTTNTEGAPLLGPTHLPTLPNDQPDAQPSNRPCGPYRTPGPETAPLSRPTATPPPH